MNTKEIIRFQKCDTIGQILLALLMKADLHELDGHNFNKKKKISAVTEPKKKKKELRSLRKKKNLQRRIKYFDLILLTSACFEPENSLMFN